MLVLYFGAGSSYILLCGLSKTSNVDKKICPRFYMLIKQLITN